MRRIVAFAAALALAPVDPVLAATPRSAAEGVAAVQWTGYITDTHCGRNGANRDHTARCVEKCLKGGSKVQIWNEADGKLYDLDSLDKVKGLVGSKVTVKGTLDPATNTIRVQSAGKAGGK